MYYSKKHLLADILVNTGLISVVIWFNKLFRRKLIILAYHRVVEEEPNETDYHSDVELVSATSEQFKWQMNYLKKNYEVCTFNSYNRKYSVQAPVSDTVIITFDDGFKDNYTLAFPVLLQHQLPAVFFVSTDYINTTRRFWFEYLVSVIQQTPQDLLRGLCKILQIEYENSRSALTEKSLSYMKTISDGKRLGIISALESFLSDNNMTLNNKETNIFPLTWKEIEEMDDEGMEIGSHTQSHPILTNLETNQKNAELFKSKKQIEAHISAPCSSISYPNGQQGEFDAEIIDIAKKAGYKFACSYISGTNCHGSDEPYSLKRIHVERYTTNNYLACTLALPWLFG